MGLRGMQCETGWSGGSLGGSSRYLGRTWIPRMPMVIWVQRERHQQSPWGRKERWVWGRARGPVWLQWHKSGKRLKDMLCGLCWALWFLAMSLRFIVKVLGLALSSDMMQSGRVPAGWGDSTGNHADNLPCMVSGRTCPRTTGLGSVVASGLLSIAEQPEAQSEWKWTIEHH